MCVRFWIDDPTVGFERGQSPVQCDEYITVLERELMAATGNPDAISELKGRFVRTGPHPNDVTVPNPREPEDDDTRTLTQSELDFLNVISNHQSLNMGRCTCGWDHRGRSWLRHLLTKIHEAGINLVRSNRR